MLEHVVAITWPGAGAHHSAWSESTVNAVSALGALVIAAGVVYVAERRRRALLRAREAWFAALDRRRSTRRWGALALPIAALALAPSVAMATPSTTYWAPSTAACQAWRVPHVTYDTYFGKGPAAGSQGAPNYPIDTGLTVGFLPFQKVQGEVGFDLLLPSQDPLYFNAKLCSPESALFKGSPGVGAGIYNMGTKKGVSDYNVLYLMAQKTIPGVGGYVAAGIYHGLSDTLFTNSEGDVVRTGAMLAFFSPDIPVGWKGLKKINLAADILTGKNVLGAGGFGAYFYFTDTIALLTGPVFFLDENLQPGGRKFMWTVQIDIDIPLGSK